MEWVLRNISDNPEKDLLCGNFEKLALSCALINISQGEVHILYKICRSAVTPAVPLHHLYEKI
eukprot:c3169_g1_i1 orf=206-394(+)